MNKSFGIRFLLATMMALAVAVVGCKDSTDQPPPGGSGGDGGSGGSGGMAALSVSADPTTTTFGAASTEIMTDTIDVTLTATGEGSDTAIIYYTTDATEVEVPGGAGGAGGAGGGAGGAGGAPASSTMEYTAPITIAANTVLKFLAVVDGGAITPQQVEGYTFTPDAESAQWAQSGHGAILDEPWRHWDESGAIGAIPREIACTKCHSAEGLLNAAAGAPLAAAPLPLGLACTGCHAAAPNIYDNVDQPTDYPALEPVTFPSGDTATLTNASNICMICHQGRESTVQVNDDITACSGVGDCDADCTPTDGAGGAGGASGCDGLGFLNIHYYAAAATFFGTEVQGGYEYDQLGAGGAGGAPTYAGQNMFPAHNGSLDDCIECHMDQNPAGAHLFIPEVTGCVAGPCHATGDSFPTLAGPPMENYDAIQDLIPALLTEIETYATDVLSEPIVYDADSYPYWFKVSDDTPYAFDATLLKAAYNYQTGLKDPGGYIHNGDYIQQILFDSISDLGGTPPGTRP